MTDFVLRIGHLPDSNLHSRRVGHVSLQLVATPEYFERHGLPQTPEDFGEHTVIAASSGDLAHDWHCEIAGRTSTMHINPRLLVNTNQAAINACKQDLGICRVISYEVENELRAGQLQTLLTEYQLRPLPVHIVYREGPNASS
ncbi:MAG: LysR substrate-binding domain-containing protein [Pseudohongiellaceae bacterium]